MDTKTGLVWSRNRYLNCSEGQLADVGPGFTWHGATGSFGRARDLKGEINYAGRYDSELGITKDCYRGYVFGSQVVAIDGLTDWRLPTVDEFWSLLEKRPSGWYMSTSLLGDKPERLWTANYNGWVNGLKAAWLFYGGGEDLQTDLVGDIPPESKEPVRFVRGGEVFRSITFTGKSLSNRKEVYRRGC
jgi:hypothetical protein